jgi:hypothetical protein
VTRIPQRVIHWVVCGTIAANLESGVPSFAPCLTKSDQTLVHAKVCRMSISLVPACLQHTKDADTTADWRVIQRDTSIRILVSHWHGA